ncbi:MAG: hypothetical protein ABIH46_10655 [Chloroflexota bacterium]
MARLLRRLPFWLTPRGGVVLLILGLSSEAIYLLVFTQPLLLTRYYDVPLMDLGKITGYSFDALWAFVVGNIALFVACCLVFNISREPLSRWAKVLILLFPLLFALTLLFAYPATAADVYDYTVQARVLTEYHDNPLVVPPGAFPDDPFSPYVVWQAAPSFYGPFWLLLSAIPSLLAGDDLLSNIIAFKFLAMAFYLGSAILIYLILSETKPSFRLSGTVFFAWNPLVLWETIANAHNDTVMVFFALLAVCLFVRRRKALALPVLALAALTKYTASLIFPLFLASFLGEKGKQRRVTISLFAGLALSAIVTLLLFYPFWSGPGTFDALAERMELVTASPAAVVFYALESSFSPDELGSFLKTATMVVFGLVYLWLVARAARGFTAMLHAAHDAIFFYLLIACLWFQPWYVVWLLGIGALLVGNPVAWRGFVFSFTGMMSYAVFVFIWVIYAEHFENPLLIQSLAVAVIYIAPVSYWLGEAFTHLKGKSLVRR